MEVKRSKGVTILAWLLIVVYSYQFVLTLSLLAPGANYFLMNSLNAVIFLVAAVMAVFLLQLKNWARIGTIVISALGAMRAIVEGPSVFGALKATSDNYQATMFPLILFAYIVALVFCCAPIYFFTRPKVKEQFK